MPWTLKVGPLTQPGGEVSLIKHISVAASTQILGADGIIFDTTQVRYDLDAQGRRTFTLPSPGDEDVRPDLFGWRFTDGQRYWNVPAQAGGTTFGLDDFTDTTPLPVPVGFGQQLSALDGRVDVLEQGGGGGGGGPAYDDGPIYAALATEMAARQSADGTQSVAITGNASAISANASAISSEVTRATTAEQANTTAIGQRVPTTRTVNGKPLSADVTLSPADVGAATAAQGTKADTAVQPAGLTKAAVGLSNVNNTSDAQKPVSTAQQAAFDAKADLVAGLIPTSQIPAIALTTGQVVANRAAMLALTNVQAGDIAVISGTTDKGSYILQGSDPSVFGSWVLLGAPTDVVQSVNGQTGTVVLGATDVNALAKANNLSDVASPSSARSNLGLGSAATQSSSAFDAAGAATAAQSAAASDATSKVATETTRAQAAEALRALDLPDVAVNAPATLTAGTNSGVTAAGTYTAPTPAATVAVPPLRFAITNRTTGAVTLSVPNPTGTVLSLSVLSGEVVTFRQVSTSGYIAESGNKPIAQLDARFAATARGLPAGGTTGQRLEKVSGADYAVQWATPTSSGTTLPSPVVYSLPADVTTPTNSTTAIFTVNLAVGTWTLNLTMTVLTGGTPNIDVFVNLGTAAGSFNGPQVTSFKATNGGYANVALTVQVVVTTTGTVAFNLTTPGAAQTVRAQANSTALSATGVVARCVSVP